MSSVETIKRMIQDVAMEEELTLGQRLTHLWEIEKCLTFWLEVTEKNLRFWDEVESESEES